MTVVAPLMVEFIKALWSWISDLSWFEKMFDSGKKRSYRAPIDYVSISALEEHALSVDGKFHLLQLVEKRNAEVESSRLDASRRAYLAFGFLVNAAISAYLGSSVHNTLWWKLFSSIVGVGVIARLAMVLIGIGFLAIVTAAVKPLFSWDLFSEVYVYYPPLAREQRQKREEENSRYPLEF